MNDRFKVVQVVLGCEADLAEKWRLPGLAEMWRRNLQAAPRLTFFYLGSAISGVDLAESKQVQAVVCVVLPMDRCGQLQGACRQV